MQFPFQPKSTAANTTNIAVTATNQTFTLPTRSAGGQVLLTNVGTQTVFIALGTVTSVATTSMPLIANTSRVISVPDGVTTLSVIAANTGSTLYATDGIGY
jgi:hypothetical protein